MTPEEWKKRDTALNYFTALTVGSLYGLTFALLSFGIGLLVLPITKALGVALITQIVAGFIVYKISLKIAADQQKTEFAKRFPDNEPDPKDHEDPVQHN